MSEAKPNKGAGLFAALGVIFGTIGAFLGAVVLRGVLRKKTWSKNAIIGWPVYFLWLTLIVYAPRWNIPALLGALSPWLMPVGISRWTSLHVARWVQDSILFLGPLSIWLFFQGILDWIATKKYQNAVDHLGLKTPTGLTPKVKRVIELDNSQRKIMVQAIGLDVAAFRDKKGALESSLNAIVQHTRVSAANRQIVEILISDKELPTLIRFDECIEKLAKPYTFLVGEAMDGFITVDLCEIHHMLIAGATGGGKSVFFKQALVGLLTSSKYLQLYLLDLKRGVDVRPFEVLDNVKISKDSVTAIATLRIVVEEMERRFKYLEESGHTEIVPERDRRDRIVVAIDEASVLFTIEKSSKEVKEQAQNARELTDKIAKLGRAAGIHVILATQKVVKETIDTRVQTNISARMCFRVNTVASSMTVLGNKKAAELPDIKGRGIWSVGSNDIVVQVPKLDNQEVIEEVNALTQKFNGDSNPLFQPMLQALAPPKGRNLGLVHKDGPSTSSAPIEAD
jgi:S-DNA-T family DNA segregation ATPase FtsK/SpoIIIE